MTEDRLDRAWTLAASHSRRLDPRDLELLAAGSDPDQRLLALALIRKQIGQGEPPEPYLHIARALVPDPDNTCRWQAMIVVGEAISSSPQSVWEVIHERGSSSDKDMRTAVATVLLEHLLEEDFSTYFPKVRDRVLSGDRLFADTLKMCWVHEPDSPQRLKIQHLLDVGARGGLRKEDSSKDAV